MKNFVAPSPDLGSARVRMFRTRDDERTLAALKAVTPPLEDDVVAELVALAFAFPTTMAHPLGKNIRKAARKLVDKHVEQAARFAAVFKNVGMRTHEYDARIRQLDDPLRIEIAKAIAFHGWVGVSVPFEEDAAFRGAILDIAVARAKRDKESTIELGEIYTEWHGSHGSATTTDLHRLPDELPDELARRRKQYAFNGLGIHGGSLTDLPEAFVQARPWLVHLSLDFNPLVEVPEVIFELSNLEVLELAGTALTDIPASIAKLRKLRRLDLGNGKRMPAIPAAVCQLDQLRELRIGNGSIKLVPEEIAGMKSLEVLEMQSTRISRLPASIATLPKLKRVEARWSKLNPQKTRAILPRGCKLEL